jgi:hypothetical protein
MDYKEFERNSICYCNSGKKYKQCHLIRNEKQGKVATKYTDRNGKEKIRIFSKEKFNIEVKNTFSEIDVAMGADFAGGDE